MRNNVAANLVYELPFGPGKSFLNSSGVLGKIVGGWEMSSVGLWHTGHPLTVAMDLPESNPIQFGPFVGLAPTYLLPDGNDQTTQRPDLVPGVPLLLLAPNSPDARFAGHADDQRGRVCTSAHGRERKLHPIWGCAEWRVSCGEQLAD